ncbi:MAG: pilus assembly protein TadG-related protein [Acidimicrobiia bacterium]|nr:pilus assembly protein TadG-related protein [Acidimicrobiia bacterium]
MRRILADEHGAVSTFLAVIALALLMAGGLAIDGGRKVNALRQVSHIADNAARAGAQAVDLDTLRTTGDLRLVPSEAADRVEAYLSTVGYVATNVTVNGATVTVTVDVTVEPVLLPTGPMTVSATETATAVTQEP